MVKRNFGRSKKPMSRVPAPKAPPDMFELARRSNGGMSPERMAQLVVLSIGAVFLIGAYYLRRRFFLP